MGQCQNSWHDASSRCGPNTQYGSVPIQHSTPRKRKPGFGSGQCAEVDTAEGIDDFNIAVGYDHMDADECVGCLEMQHGDLVTVHKVDIAGHSNDFNIAVDYNHQSEDECLDRLEMQHPNFVTMHEIGNPEEIIKKNVRFFVLTTIRKSLEDGLSE